MTQRLTHPAPARCWYPTGEGRFGSRAWTISDVISALSAGAWFSGGLHDFESPKAAYAANNAAALRKFLLELPK